MTALALNRNNPPAPPTAGQQLALGPVDAARALGISTRHLWSLTQRGAIPVARIGRRTIYPVAALNEWLAGQIGGGGGKGRAFGGKEAIAGGVA